MKFLFTAICFLFLVYSCGRGKYFVSSVFRKGEAVQMNEIILDSTYRFYLREVYKDKNQLNENVLKTNVQKKDTANKVRIEVEYLLLSWLHKNAIYISTIPDKFQHYYSTNRLADTLINAYDFSTFHFGKIAGDGESISFVSPYRSRSIVWDIRPFFGQGDPPQVSIREIAVQKADMLENVILIRNALEEPLVFTRQNSYTIVFSEAAKAHSGQDSLHLCSLLDNKIYFQQGSKGFSIYFRFNANVSESKDSVIGFDYKRTRYSPAFLSSQ